MALFTKNAKNEWVITELPEGAGAGDRIEVTTPDGRTVRVRIHLLVTKGDGSRYATARGAAMLAVGTKKAPKKAPKTVAVEAVRDGWDKLEYIGSIQYEEDMAEGRYAQTYGYEE